MSLKDRLDRLGKGAPLNPRQRASQSAPAPAPIRATQALAEVPPGESKDAFSDLRLKMAALLVSPESSQADLPGRVPPVAEDVLPFGDVDLGYGAFARKVAPLRRSARVGRMPLSAAYEADAGMLSLLALDPKVATAEPRRALYIDTETTGLGGAGTLAFLIGLAWFNEEGDLTLEQLLVREPAQESAALARVSALVARASLLVSFNGKSFDWPLLKARCIMNRLPPLPERPHLDLLHVGKRLHKRRLSRFRLKDLELEVLGWDRGEEDIPGEEIPPRYGHFLRTGDGEALRPVILHNEWDVLTMAALVGLYGEPIDNLEGADLLCVAETLTRARAYEQAGVAAERAVHAGQKLEALELLARLNKARGDRARALRDFEALSREVDDPAVRLELAKLFEHHAKDFEGALRMVELGTGEDEEALSRRRQRLVRRAATRTLRAKQKER